MRANWEIVVKGECSDNDTTKLNSTCRIYANNQHRSIDKPVHKYNVDTQHVTHENCHNLLFCYGWFLL